MTVLSTGHNSMMNWFYFSGFKLFTDCVNENLCLEYHLIRFYLWKQPDKQLVWQEKQILAIKRQVISNQKWWQLNCRAHALLCPAPDIWHARLVINICREVPSRVVCYRQPTASPRTALSSAQSESCGWKWIRACSTQNDLDTLGSRWEIWELHMFSLKMFAAKTCPISSNLQHWCLCLLLQIERTKTAIEPGGYVLWTAVCSWSTLAFYG